VTCHGTFGATSCRGTAQVARSRKALSFKPKPKSCRYETSPASITVPSGSPTFSAYANDSSTRASVSSASSPSDSPTRAARFAS
jgi:hypothetical protein